jgi:Zn-dependent M28 family amino/carboxypeptidase
MLFYVSGIILLWQRKSWKKRLNPLNPVGRMALSNYIFQSIVATLIFYGYGLGLYGDVSRIFALGLTVVIFYIQVRLSSNWFEAHDYGPLEWIWRYLTYGHVAKVSASAEYTTRYTVAKRKILTILNRGYRSPIVLFTVWVFLVIWGGILFYLYKDLRPDTTVMVASVAERLIPERTETDVDDEDNIETSKQGVEVVPPLVQPVAYVPLGPASTGDMPALAAAFNPGEAMHQIEALTSKDYQGRQAGSDAGKGAAEYIAEQFEQFGLRPVGDEGTYYQTFPVTYTPLDTIPTLSVQLLGSDQYSNYQIYRDYSPFVRWYSGWGEVTGEAFWADDCERGDLFGLDVRGNILVCLADTRQNWLLEASRNALEYGAAGLLFVTDPKTRPADFGYAFKDVWVPEPLPTFRIYPELAEDIISGSGYTLDGLLSVEESFPLKTSVSLSLSITQTDTCPGTECAARNVLGVIPGRDPEYANELVILSAHYDHMGSSPDGTYWPGANDNASGVAVLLEIARSWREHGFVPRRTVMFAAWDAEEIGLLGSYYYVDHPVYPLESTLSVINLDMIGVGTESLTIAGSETLSSHLVKLANEKNVTTHLTDSGRSDHAPFLESGIEAALLIWEDDGSFIDHYHRPADNIDVIEPEGLSTVAEIANLALLDIVESQPAIDDMLIARENAIMNGDLQGFLATSSRAQEVFDEAWVEDLSTLEISQVKLQSENLSIAGNYATANMQINIEHIDPSTQPITQVLEARLPVQITYEGGAWMWAGPDLHLVDTTDSSDPDVSPSVNVFADPSKSDYLAGIAEQIAQSYQEISDQLDGPPGVLVDVYLLPDNESFRASTSLTTPEGQNQWVTTGALKLIYSDQISSSKILDDSLVKLYLADAGITEDAIPWLWNGLPLVFEEQELSIAVQKRFIPTLHSNIEAGEDADTLASDWAATHYLLDKLGWTGVGKFIIEFGELCKSGRCGGQNAVNGVYTTNLGVDQQRFEADWQIHWDSRLTAAQNELDAMAVKRSLAVEENDSNSFMQTVDDNQPYLQAEQAHWFRDSVQLGAMEYKYRPIAFLPDGDILAKVFIVLGEETDESAGNLTTVTDIHFARGERGFTWAGPDFSETTGDWLEIHTPNASADWAAGILPEADRYYLKLTGMLGMEPVKGMRVSIYETPGELEFSIAQSIYKAEKITEWTARDEGIKLIMRPQWDDQLYLGTIAKLLAKNLLLEVGLSDDWLLRGLSIYMTQSFNNQEMKNATRELFKIVESDNFDQFFDLEDFPNDHELSADERKIADAQSWDAVRYLVNQYGWQKLTQLIDFSRRGYSLDRSLQLALGVPIGEFAENWQISTSHGHMAPEWGDIVNQFDTSTALEYIGILAAPELGGRLSGTPGAQLSAEYISDIFTDLSLLPTYQALSAEPSLIVENYTSADDNDIGSVQQETMDRPLGSDAYYQQFPITRTVLSATPTFSLVDNQSANELILPYRRGFMIRQLGNGASHEYRGQLIWAGNHPDIEIDLREKIVLQASTQDLAREMIWASERGAAALIIAGNKRENEDIYAKLPLMLADDEDTGLPVLELTQMGYTDMLERIGHTRSSIRELEPGTALDLVAELQIFTNGEEIVPAKNVLGWLPGSDPILKDEVIIVGAHYDHVGDDPGLRYSGANDNASGVSIMLELARLWQKTGYQPKRSIVFAAWDAQEYGNLGSTNYCENPIIPLESTIAVVNLDGVAGGDGFNLGITGNLETDSLLLLATRAAGEYLDEKITWVNDTGKGDHVPFHDVGVPSSLLAWRLANEDNLPDEYANGVNPDRLETAGKIVALVVMALAQ